MTRLSMHALPTLAFKVGYCNRKTMQENVDIL